MRFSQLLEKVLVQTSIGIDARVYRTVVEAAQTLCRCRHLSIAALGRCLSSTAQVKHAIKRMDRLFGNRQLHERRESYYRTMAHLLIGAQPQPVILVDWSGLTRCGEFHFLRASVAVGGRALVVWESTYREKDYASAKAHREFVETLKRVLPQTCRPIVVTDAGFRNPWFKLIAKQGWHFVGRARHATHCQQAGHDEWLCSNDYYAKARRSACHLFAGLLAKANPLHGHFYLYKDKPKNRKRKNLRGKAIRSSVSLKHAKGAREPWLLFSSLPPEQITPKALVAMYATRMQIEEAFRDLKNTRNGFSLRHCRSFSIERLNVALLLGAIAMLALWLLGLIAKQQSNHYSFQANTIRDRAVLSTFTIGWQCLMRQHAFTFEQFHLALASLKTHAAQPKIN